MLERKSIFALSVLMYFLIFSLICDSNIEIRGSKHIKEIASQADFDQALKQNLSVIEFYMPSCGACQQFAPQFEKFARDHAPHANFYKVDIEKNEDITSKNGIEEVPTVIFVKNGEVLQDHKIVGADIGKVENNLKKLIGK